MEIERARPLLGTSVFKLIISKSEIDDLIDEKVSKIKLEKKFYFNIEIRSSNKVFEESDFEFKHDQLNEVFFLEVPFGELTCPMRVLQRTFEGVKTLSNESSIFIKVKIIIE